MCGWTTECLLKANSPSPPPSLFDNEDDPAVSVSFAARDGLEINGTTEQGSRYSDVLFCFYSFSTQTLGRFYGEEVAVARPIQVKTYETPFNPTVLGLSLIVI